MKIFILLMIVCLVFTGTSYSHDNNIDVISINKSNEVSKIQVLDTAVVEEDSGRVCYTLARVWLPKWLGGATINRKDDTTNSVRQINDVVLLIKQADINSTEGIVLGVVDGEHVEPLSHNEKWGRIIVDKMNSVLNIAVIDFKGVAADIRIMKYELKDDPAKILESKMRVNEADAGTKNAGEEFITIKGMNINNEKLKVIIEDSKKYKDLEKIFSSKLGQYDALGLPPIEIEVARIKQNAYIVIFRRIFNTKEMKLVVVQCDIDTKRCYEVKIVP